MNRNEIPLRQNQLTENNLINDCIRVDNISTGNDNVLETLNENANTNFDGT